MCSVSLCKPECFSFVLLTFILSSFLLLLLLLLLFLAFWVKEIAIFFFLTSSGMFCYVCLNKISWPRKSGCLQMPSHSAVYLKRQCTPRKLLSSLLSWMGRGMSGRSKCCKRVCGSALPTPGGFLQWTGITNGLLNSCLPALNPVQECSLVLILST